MADFPNKFQNMVDEMNRFEEEIGLPYTPEMHAGQIPSQPFVLGTNTFSQAQQKIFQINHSDDLVKVSPNIPAFIPAQVLQAPQPGVIPPPPAPPLSMPPAGMRFPQGIPIPYNQPMPTTSQPPPAFSNPLMMRPEPVNKPVTVPPATTSTFARRPTTTTWPNRNTFKQQTPPKPEMKPADESPKVVLSATPKLYTPKVEKVEDCEYGTNMNSRLVGVDIPKSTCDVGSLAKKTKPNEVPKHTPVSSYISAVEAAQAADKKRDKKQKKFIRVSGGQTWEDPTLTEWDDGDFRLFCGDLGNDVTDELLTRIFSRYPSFSKAKVVRDKRTNKTKGFGFISFKDPQDFIRASKEMNGRYVGSRPIKLRKSTWKNRNLDIVKKKEKEKAALIAMLTGK